MVEDRNETEDSGLGSRCVTVSGMYRCLDFVDSIIDGVVDGPKVDAFSEYSG